MEVIPIPGHRVEKFWFHVEPWLASAIEKAHGEMEIQDAQKFCVEGKMQLFGLWDGERFVGAYMTELVVFPRKRQLLVVALGAEDFDPWIEVVSEDLKVYQEKFQCDETTVIGRFGWIRKLKGVGFKPRYTLLARGD